MLKLRDYLERTILCTGVTPEELIVYYKLGISNCCSALQNEIDD